MGGTVSCFLSLTMLPCLFAGLPAGRVDDWWAGDVRGYRGWRHGGLGQGAQTLTHTFIRVSCMSFMWSVLLKCCVLSHVSVVIFYFYVAYVISQVIVSVCVARLAIRRDRWATSPRNTCSSPPPTVCWACSSPWQHLMLDRTPRPTQPSRSCTPTA